MGRERQRFAFSARLLGALAVLAGALLLAAGCGGSNIESSSRGPAPEVDAGGPVEGKLTISQWPLYIDPGKHGTVAQFEAATGVNVGSKTSTTTPPTSARCSRCWRGANPAAAA